MMRAIQKAMVNYLDAKLKNNGLAQQAITDKLPRVLALEAAKACVGIREQGGNNRGPLVELIQQTIGIANRESWCASFVQTCIAYAEVKTGVLSPIFPTEGTRSMWEDTTKTQRVKYTPLAGAICVWQHGTSWQGHTGFVVSCDEKNFSAIEGNTESGIVGTRVVRDGGGVYLTNRSLKGNGDMHILGFLKPF
jgi:hypothetical protein